MKKQDLWKITIVVIILIVFIYLIIVSFYKELNKNEEINSFEECASAGFVVGESYPRQCWTPNGKHFVEEITWENDGIFLMQNSETGEYACFGCSTNAEVNLCIDPAPIMEPVEETPERYCNDDFKIIEEEKIFCSNDSRNAEVCITLYDPVCGWNNPDKINCIKFPCASTYSNSCNACKNPDVLYFTKGKCPSG